MCGRNLHVRTGELAYITERAIVSILEHSVRLPILLLVVLIRVLTSVGIRAEQVLKAIVIEVVNPVSPATHGQSGESHTSFIGVRAKESGSLTAEERERLAC